MNANDNLTLQRLLPRREATSLIHAIGASVPNIALALVRLDGALFVSTDNWTSLAGSLDLPEHLRRMERDKVLNIDQSRIYPLFAAENPVGALVALGSSRNQEYPLERAVHASIALMITQSLEKRDVATEALDRFREINLIYRVSETIGASFDVDRIPVFVLDEGKRVIRANAGIVLLSPSDGDANWETRATFGDDGLARALNEFTKTALNTQMPSDRPAIVTDFPGTTDYGSLLWAPFKTQDRVLGGVVLGRLLDEPIFTASDQKLLMALARQAAVAVDNARLHRAVLDKERLEHELQLARNVQASLIPSHAPIIPGWDFAAYWNPAREVSGDFYDFISGVGASSLIAPRSTDETPPMLGIVIGDVSDKGMHAALFMALTRSVLRAATTSGHLPADGLMLTNRLLCADSTGGMFVTLFYGQLDPIRNEITYVNAGHNPPLVYRAKEHRFDELDRTGIMLGFDDAATLKQKLVQFSPGDFVVFYTDGVTEAFNHDDEQFGDERLHDVLLVNQAASPQEMLRTLRGVLANFVGDRAQSDDITIVIAKFAGEVISREIKISAARIQDLELLSNFLDVTCEQAHIPEQDVFALHLALEEVFVNLVTHGYENRPSGPVDVTLQIDPGKAVVIIQDQAPPFAPEQAPEPPLDQVLQTRTMGGLGWHFIRQTMDEIRYDSDPHEGNRLTLLRRLKIYPALARE